MKADSSEDEKSERQGDNKISEVQRGGEECEIFFEKDTSKGGEHIERDVFLSCLSFCVLLVIYL